MCRAIVAAAGTRATATTVRPLDPVTGATRDIPCPAGVARPPKRAQGRHVPTTASARAGTAWCVTVPKLVCFNVRTPPLRPCILLWSLLSAINGNHLKLNTRASFALCCVVRASFTLFCARAIVAAAGTRATATTARRTDPATGATQGIPCLAGVARSPKRAQGRHVPTAASARAGTARCVTDPKLVCFNVRTPPLRPCIQKTGFFGHCCPRLTATI